MYSLALYILVWFLDDDLTDVIEEKDINLMGTEEQRVQSNRGRRGTVDAEEQRAQRNSGHRETEGTEEQWAQRNRRYRGTVGT